MSLRHLLPLVCTLGACAPAGCASLPAPDLPTCDGASRRPANPYGSILSPASPPVAAAIDSGTQPSGGCA